MEKILMKFIEHLPLVFFYVILSKILVKPSPVELGALIILAVYILIHKYNMYSKKLKELESSISEQKNENKRIEDRLDKIKMVVDGLQILRNTSLK